VQKPDWAGILERARRDDLLVADLDVRLYCDGTFHHGSQFCGHNAREVVLTGREAVATVAPGWCECGGWLGTRFGSLLRAVADHYQAIEEEAGDARHPDWQSAWQAFSGLAETQSWIYRTDDVELDTLRRRTMLSTLALLERSRDGLDVADLERRIAAQALTVPVRPDDGAFLQRWARDLRIESRPVSPARRDAVRLPFDDTLDLALEEARRYGDTVLLVVLGGRDDGLPIDRGVPPELGLLLWARGVPARTTVVHHVHRPIGEGIALISSGNHRVAVAGTDETDPDVLEAVRTLCEDVYAGTRSPEGRGRPGVDLDEILATARML